MDGAARGAPLSATLSTLASEEVLRKVLDSAGDVIVHQSPDRIIQYVSPSVTDVLGWSPSELVGRSASEFWHPDDLAAAAKGGLDIQGGGSARLRGRQLRKDGTYAWVEAVARPITDEAGTVIGLVSITRDIDEQVRGQESLARSEARFRMLAENSSDVVFQTTPDGTITWVSPSVEAILGYSAADLVHSIAMDLVDPDDRPAAKLHRARVYAGAQVSHIVVRFVAADGSRRYMSVVSRPLVDDAGTLIGSVVGLHEIDEQVRERERLQATLDSLLDPHMMLQALRDPSGRIVDFVFTDANEAACLYNAKSKAELLGMRMLELLPGHAGTGLLAMYAAVVETGEPLALDDFTYAHEAQHGELRYYDVRAVRQGDALSYTWRDVTDRHASAEAIRESAERYRLLAENAMDLVISLDMKAKVQWVSPSVSTMLGYEPRELLGRFSAVLFRADDLPLMLDTAARAREGEPVACRLRMVTKGGDERWVEVTPRTLHDATGTLVGGVIGVRDVHEEVTARAALEHEVEFDALTGLARRPAALAWIREILGARHDSPWALLCVGINGMTSINQAYTYAAGDAVLRAAADRLVAAAAAHDHVARIAGDEFAVLLRADVSESDAANEAERLLTAVRGVVAVGAQQVEVTACVGIAMFTGQDAEDLLRDATAAMRQAAAVGRDRWEFLGGNVGEQTRQALEVQSQLRGALREGRIRPWLMPIVSMATGDVVGYEALARWMLADGTVKAPDEFLGVAERTGLVREIDRVILSESLDALTTMAQQISLGVNVSGVTLASPDFADSVRRELERTGIDPSRLSLEVTETALFRITDSVRSSMESLAELGASWWVDDFGTGFSSISHLRDLPIAGLKLDRSFTSGVTFGSSRATRLSRGLAGLAHGLGLATVAEGVETAEQAEVLAGQGWQMGQGWLYGKPVPLPVAAGVAPTMS